MLPSEENHEATDSKCGMWSIAEHETYICGMHNTCTIWIH